MTEDELEKLRSMADKLHLEAQLQEARRRELNNQKWTRRFFFLAIWWLPLFGMQLAGYEPKPEIGPLSIWGAWFLAVPIGFWIYCRNNKIDGG